MADLPTTTFKPVTGEIFMMAFNSGDRSYLEYVFRVLDCDDRLTIAEAVVGYKFSGKPFVFKNSDVTFFETSPERAELLGVEKGDDHV